MLSWEFKLAWGENCSRNRKIRATVDSRIYENGLLTAMKQVRSFLAAHPSLFFREYHPRAGACMACMPVTNLGFLYFNPSPVPGLSLSRARSISQSCTQKGEASFLPARTLSQGMEYDQPDRNRLSYHVKAFVFLSNLLIIQHAHIHHKPPAEWQPTSFPGRFFVGLRTGREKALGTGIGARASRAQT